MSAPRSQEQDNQPAPAFPAERQLRVEALADEYLERLLAGETPDRQQLLAAHPLLADLLGPRLELVELMHRVARAQRSAEPETASPAPPGILPERAFRLKCPHCGNGIQLVDLADGEVTCGSCGSSFHVDARATTTYNRAALPRSIGKFEVLEQLGRGAFGTVYKARDPELQRLVAVKVPRSGSFATAEEEERFLREARAAAQLSHPGIVPVLEIAHDRGVPYIVSEYVEGLTLADVLTARRPNFRESAELVAAVADALDYAHRQKIVHRDIKPSNLLLDAAGRPHITDFGLARRGDNEITVTLDGQILGTPAYMSPEQAAGDQHHVDARSDVYSLGVVLYELLTGELPFRGNQRMLLHQVIHDEPRPPRSLNDRVPRDLETICLKAMAKTPGRRYGSAQEIADDLRRFLNGEPIRARRVGRTEKLARWVRRNPVVASLTAMVALLLVAVAAGEFLFVVTERRLNHDLSDALDTSERNHREAELRAASAAVDLDLKHCEDGEIEYGVLRLARTLAELPPHATELRQCVEMNLLAWAQEIRPLGPTFQYDGAETKWELSPDGLTVLTGGEDGTARLWNAFTGEVRATLRGHRGGIASLAFNKSGRVAMTVGDDRTVRLWDANNGQAMGVTSEHRNRVEKALLSPDGRRLLTICQDQIEVTLWETGTGRRISDFAGHAGHINDAVFSPDGQVVLTAGEDCTARLWSAEMGRPIAVLRADTGAVVGVGVSPKGDVVATLERERKAGKKNLYDYRVRWWDPLRGAQIAPPCKMNEVGFFQLIHPDVAFGHFYAGLSRNRGSLCIRGKQHSIEMWTDLVPCRADDYYLVDSGGTVYERSSGKRLAITPGRKFGDQLLRFSTQRRFIELAPAAPSDAGATRRFIDLSTEKAIGGAFLGNDISRLRFTAVYVPDRQTFMCLERVSLRYIAILDSPLDAEVARLFAEVVTCHELDPGGTTQLLDETEWEKRRQKLAGRLDEHSVPSHIRGLAADPWFWLRRQAGRVKSAEDRIKYLDRLIAVEPSWQNYHRRSLGHYNIDRRAEAARDLLEAAKRAGEGYWHHGQLTPARNRGSFDGTDRARRLTEELLLPATRSAEEHQVGLSLAEALSRAFPEDRDYRVLHAIALYRVGRYTDASSHLEGLLKERDRDIASQVGQYFMLGWPAVPRAEWELAGRGDILRTIAFLAMTHHRLGHPDRARAALDDLRRLGDVEWSSPMGTYFLRSGRRDYPMLLHEAEALIEGKPRPGK